MKKAFTLIELLVVVLIIGILSAIALPQYTRTIEKARLAEAMQTMAALQRAIDIYILENGQPTSYISFLGNGADGQNTLSIDVTQAMTCSTSVSCHNQYFLYQATCGANSCDVRAARISPGDSDYKYNLDIIKPKDGDWTPGDCDYQDGYEYICAGMEAFGYTRSACC